MIAEPATRTRFQPHGSKLLVRFTETAEQTEGGIWLPDKLKENWTEATVLAAGSGTRAAEGGYFPCWPRKHDTITFERHKAQVVGVDEETGRQEAVIDAEDVMALVFSDRVIPLSDWVAVRPEARPQVSAGGVRLSDRVQHWRTRGTILEYGCGALEMEGGCAIRRRTVHEIMNLPWDMPLAGVDVFWARNSEIIQLGRERVELWLVRAGDILAFVEEEDEMPKIVDSQGKSRKVAYLTTDVPPNKARRGQKASKMGVKAGLKGARP